MRTVLRTVRRLYDGKRSKGDAMVADLTLSAGEAAARLGVHEKTVRRWIEAGIVTPHRAPGKPYELTETHYQTLQEHASTLKRHQRLAPPSSATDASEIADLRTRIERIERELTRLRGRLPLTASAAYPSPTMAPSRTQDERQTALMDDEGQSGRAIRFGAQRATGAYRPSATDRGNLDADTAYLGEFAERHGVPVGTAKHQALRLGKFPSTTMPRRGRPEQNEHFLVGEQRNAALAYWRSEWRGDTHRYQTCDAPGCPCQATLGV